MLVHPPTQEYTRENKLNHIWFSLLTPLVPYGDDTFLKEKAARRANAAHLPVLRLSLLKIECSPILRLSLCNKKGGSAGCLLRGLELRTIDPAHTLSILFPLLTLP